MVSYDRMLRTHRQASRAVRGVPSVSDRDRRSNLEQMTAGAERSRVAELEARVATLEDTLELRDAHIEVLESRLREERPRKPYPLMERLRIIWLMEYFQIPQRRLRDTLGVSRSSVRRWLKAWCPDIHPCRKLPWNGLGGPGHLQAPYGNTCSECVVEGDRLRSSLVDKGSVTRRWNGLAGRAGGFEPGGLGPLNLGQCLFGGLPEGGAGFEIGDVGDVAAVLLTVEYVDVVVGHG
jgi:hypothetical protein